MFTSDVISKRCFTSAVTSKHCFTSGAPTGHDGSSDILLAKSDVTTSNNSY